MAKNYIKKWQYHKIKALSESFELVLQDTKDTVYCDKIIRIIPGKRLVAFGKWGNQAIVAKLFSQKRQLQSDVSGITVLTETNIPTPRLLYQGTGLIDNKKIDVLLFERITPSKDLDLVWQEKKDSYESTDFIELMNNVVTEIATQHVLGIQQRDLHLKNFLVTENKIYTLDGGGIKKTAPTLDKKSSLNNLGLFLSQLGINTEPLQEKLFNTYSTLRGWMIQKSDINLLKKIITYKNKNRRKNYYKKVFRNCTAFSRINLFKKVIICNRNNQSPLLKNFLYHPEKIFEHPDSILLKAGRTSTVVKICIDNRWFVVKRYNIKNPWHWLRRCLRKTRAANSWWLAHYLTLLGIPTAKPVAYVDTHFLGLRGTSYFIMDFIAGQTIGEFFAASSNLDEKTDEKTSEIAKRILNLLNHLGKLKITHGDLKMTNILLENQKPILIDLDGMREHSTTFGFTRAFQKEIERFMRNWEEQPTIYELFKKLLSENYY